MNTFELILENFMIFV